jgi:hypothetical protein
MNAKETCTLGIVALGLSLIAGCGRTAAVSGSVTYDGQPVANGSITFTPEDGKGPVAGGPITEGKYRIVGVTPGRKIAQIIGVKKVNFAQSHEEAARVAKVNAAHGDSSGITERADTVPPDAEGNNRVVDVQPGNTEINFTLKSAAGGPATK